MIPALVDSSGGFRGLMPLLQQSDDGCGGGADAPAVLLSPADEAVGVVLYVVPIVEQRFCQFRRLGQVVVHGEASLPGVDLADSLGVLGGYLALGPSLYCQAQEVSGGEAQNHAQCPVPDVGGRSCGAGQQVD